MSKLWGGRFSKETDRKVHEFSASISYDSRLWLADLTGSIAHARMLGKTGVISASEATDIIRGLESVREDLFSGTVCFDITAEDVHSEVERLLKEKIGVVAGKLHTARSRNDQVATASRLYLRAENDALIDDIIALQKVLVTLGERHLRTVLPGFTHLQHAQPISLAHHLMAYFWMLERDKERLRDLKKRLNILPLGSAALAGTSFPLDREMVAQELGFDSISQNSLDAVSDRDFVVEFLSGASLIMTHLSRLSEELVLWSTPEFGFVELDDSVTTGSSIMPQKKNPDVAELIRGKVGRVNGALVSMLTTLKALPLSYNPDLQEDKEQLFDALDTVRSCVQLMGLMLQSASFNTERMIHSLKADFSSATDLADYLAKKGVPFRECHEIVGKIVVHCIERGLGLEDLSAQELSALHSMIEADAVELLTPEAVMNARKSPGGTSPDSVKVQIAHAKNLFQ